MASKVSTMRRYLAVYLPWLPAERAIRKSIAPPDAPFVLVDKIAGTMRVVATSPAASCLGLVGLKLADARAREPGLLTVDNDVAADAALLRWLANACEIYSPSVAIHSTHTIMVDISGQCNSDGQLFKDVEQRFTSQRITIIHRTAISPDAAAALARFHEANTTHALPISALGVAPAVHIALRRAGFVTIADLAALPRAAMAARFGKAVVDSLACLLGERDVPIVPLRSPPALAVEHRFATPALATAAVLRILDRLVTRAGGILAQRHEGGRRFEASLFRTDGHVAQLIVETSVPTREAQIIKRLIAERIESLADPLDPGFGYDLLRLSVPVTERLGPVQLMLDDASTDGDDIGALIDRLTIRLGRERVRRLVPGDSHIPEQAAFDLPATTTQSHTWLAAVDGEPPMRPLCLFDPPQRIEVLAEVPDGPPRAFRWQRTRHLVSRHEGPERIAAEWWRRRTCGPTRDYYRIEDTNGRRFWIFRHGLFGSEKAHPSWYLHGLFA